MSGLSRILLYQVLCTYSYCCTPVVARIFCWGSFCLTQKPTKKSGDEQCATAVKHLLFWLRLAACYCDVNVEHSFLLQAIIWGCRETLLAEHKRWPVKSWIWEGKKKKTMYESSLKFLSSQIVDRCGVLYTTSKMLWKLNGMSTMQWLILG